MFNHSHVCVLCAVPLGFMHVFLACWALFAIVVAVGECMHTVCTAHGAAIDVVYIHMAFDDVFALV